MTVNDSRLWKGTLTFGDPTDTTGGECEGQATNVVIEQQDGDQEDVAYVLSGESVGGETSAGAWHITGTFIQDFDATPSLQQWSYWNKDSQVPFTFTPNDNTTAPTVTGLVNVKFIGLGGDVKVRITRDIDWGIQGDPDFGDWGTPTPSVPATGATAGAPGTYTPSGSTPPANLAGIQAIPATPTSTWDSGDYVVLGDASNAYWDGTTWQVGISPGLATDATSGTPGAFTPSDAVTPQVLADLDSVTASPTAAWATGEYVELDDGSDAYWDGTAWQTGTAP